MIILVRPLPTDSLKCLTNRWLDQIERQVCVLQRRDTLTVHVRARVFYTCRIRSRAEVQIVPLNLRVSNRVRRSNEWFNMWKWLGLLENDEGEKDVWLLAAGTHEERDADLILFPTPALNTASPAHLQWWRSTVGSSSAADCPTFSPRSQMECWGGGVDTVSWFISDFFFWFLGVWCVSWGFSWPITGENIWRGSTEVWQWVKSVLFQMTTSFIFYSR